MPAFDRGRRCRGFTLVELIVTILVVGVAALGITSTLSFAFARQSDGLWQAKSVALAESYLEEILARRYDEAAPVGGVPPCAPAAVPCTGPGTEGESRAQFDDVDDYDGLDESPPLDADGNPRAEYAGYRVQVAVAYPDPAQVAVLGLDDASDAKLITLWVTPPRQSPLRFVTLRGNY